MLMYRAEEVGHALSTTLYILLHLIAFFWVIFHVTLDSSAVNLTKISISVNWFLCNAAVLADNGTFNLPTGSFMVVPSDHQHPVLQ